MAVPGNRDIDMGGVARVTGLPTPTNPSDAVTKSYADSLGGGSSVPVTTIGPVSAGTVTTATTAYTSGDQVGALITFTNAASAAGKGGMISKVIISDISDVLGPCDLLLFNDTLTLVSADNGAISINDADIDKWIGAISCNAVQDIAQNRIVYAQNLETTYTCVGTSLYGVLVTRSANAVFAGGATSVKVLLDVLKDP